VRRALFLLLAGCPSLHALPKDQACTEAGYAISGRTFECTADPDLSNERYLQFERDYDCVPLPDWQIEGGTAGTRLVGDTGDLPYYPPDAFHCAFAIRQLPCELVDEYGDDLDLWLATSDACEIVVAPAGGGA
jgi:hypothetical protein